MTDTYDPYASTKPFLGQKPAYIAETFEQNRISSYAAFEQIYDNAPKVFKLIGETDRALYVPSGRSLIETMNRYVAPGMSAAPDPAYGTPNAQELAMLAWTDFARRERFYSKFATAKRYGLIRGDWAFHLYADPTREPGSMVSIFAIDPASMFPLYNAENIDEIVGWHIVDYYLNDQGDPVLRRLTYRKVTGRGGPSPITVEDAIYDPEEWGGPGMVEEDAKVLEVLRPPTQLPDPIDHLPIYHIPNRERPGMIWGVSEMAGMEVLMRGINQAISDEDLGLAMDALGVWVTDSGSPVDENGDEVAWNLGPGRVVEIQTGSGFKREGANNSVTPYQDHLKYLHGQIDEGASIPAVAKGMVEVTVAESGIALAIQFAPLLAQAAEKDQRIIDTLTNLFFDLPKWYVAYEGSFFNPWLQEARLVPTFGPKLPTNDKQDIESLLSLATSTPPVVSAAYVRTKLRQMHQFADLPDEATITAEITAEAQTTQDAFGARVDAEVAGELGVGEI